MSAAPFSSRVSVHRRRQNLFSGDRSGGSFFDNFMRPKPYIADIFPYIADDIPYIADIFPYIADDKNWKPLNLKQEFEFFRLKLIKTSKTRQN